MVEHEQQLDVVFRALADPTRRDMLRRLSFGEHTVSELAEPFEMSLAAASRHIKVLEGAGLAQREISGRRHLLRLAPERLLDVQEWLRFYERFWTNRRDAPERALSEGEM